MVMMKHTTRVDDKYSNNKHNNTVLPHGLLDQENALKAQ